MLATTLFTVVGLLATARAHLELSNPFPIKSNLDPAVGYADKDYSYTSPLVTSGTYPCKGYLDAGASLLTSKATITPGQDFTYTVTGSATHGGGSCQLSLSYDNGTTWSVIFSQMGGCPIEDMTNTITFPTEAPAGQAVFAWGWFNLEGNREMYHNCAIVTIADGGSGDLSNTQDFPTPFVANAGVNDCVTVAGVSVVFPNPGKYVKYGGEYNSSKPTTPAGFTGTNCVGPGASSGGSGSGSGTGSASPSTSASTDITPTSSSEAVSTPAATTPSTETTDVASKGAPSSIDTHPSSASVSVETAASTTPGTTSTLVTAQHAVDPSASTNTASATTPAGTGSTCSRKRRRRGLSSPVPGHTEKRHERRHERFLRRRPRHALQARSA